MPAAASAPLSSSELFQVHQNVDGNQVIVPSFVQFLNLEGRELRHLRVDHVLAGHIPPHPLVVAETPQCWWMLFQNSFSFCWSNRHRAGEVSEPTLMKRSGESLAQLPVVAEEGTSEKAAAAAARRNETRKKTKKHFHSSALPSKPQQKVADKIRQATLQDQFLICGWSPSYQTQNSTPCVPQQMSGPSGPNSPHIPTPEISPWLTLDTQPELRFPGHDLPIFH